MRTLDDARTLAEALVTVGRSMGKQVSAIITSMDQPLGRSVGNALEIAETIAILSGNGPADSTQLTLVLGAEMLRLAGLATNERDALPVLLDKLASGAALNTFRTMVSLHGGDPRVIDDPKRFPTAPRQTPIIAAHGGFVSEVDAGKIGRACLLLGAGRTKTTDAIDHAAGISDLVKIGEKVSKGQTLAVFHAATETGLAAATEAAAGAFVILPDPVTAPPLILERL